MFRWLVMSSITRQIMANISLSCSDVQCGWVFVFTLVSSYEWSPAPPASSAYESAYITSLLSINQAITSLLTGWSTIINQLTDRCCLSPGPNCHQLFLSPPRPVAREPGSHWCLRCDPQDERGAWEVPTASPDFGRLESSWNTDWWPPKLTQFW